MPIPNNYAAPVYLSAKDRAFQQLQEWIIDGTLQPGEKINDTELAQAIGVSRTPVREALQMLSLQGFVSMKPGVATTVNGVNAQDVEKIMPPLAVLEGLAAELATAKITPEDLAALRVHNRDFAAAIHAGDAFQAMKHDEQFHDLIVKACDNGYIESSISVLQAHMRRLFYLQAIILAEASIGEHERLIAAFEAGDAALAAQYARENWLRPIKNYAEAKRREQEQGA